MRYKNISFVIFFVKEVNFLANCCDECCYNYFGYCTEKLIADFRKYVENAIKMNGEEYKPQTQFLNDFINHYKYSKEMLPEKLESFLDVLLKIPISNEDLINIMKKELDYETKKEQLGYIDIDRIVEVENIEEMADKEKRYILKKEDVNTIRKDLTRTFYKIQGFNVPENLNIFRKILYNFISQLYKSGINTGYVQGMNFYAGFFLLLCKQEDPSGKLAFKLLYLFMTKKWLVNDYLKGDFVIETTKNQPEKTECFENSDYNILSFFEEGLLWYKLFFQNIINSLRKTYILPPNLISFLDATFSQCFMGLGIPIIGLNFLSLLNRVFFFILLFENYKILFDILKYWCLIFLKKLAKIEDNGSMSTIKDFFEKKVPQIIFNRYI